MRTAVPTFPLFHSQQKRQRVGGYITNFKFYARPPLYSLHIHLLLLKAILYDANSVHNYGYENMTQTLFQGLL